MLDKNVKAFIMYVASLFLDFKIIICPAQEAKIALLVARKVTILTKYLDYANIFLKKLAIELPKYFDINKHLINLKPGKQPPYKSLYNLNQIKLKTFKIGIEINLANNFICSSKFLAQTSILVV